MSHGRKHGVDAVVCSGGVDCQQLVPLVGLHVGDGAIGDVRAGAVDEDVDLAELVHEPGEEPPHALAIGHVAIERNHGGCAREAFCGFRELIVTATAESDLCAGGGEAMCDRAADAGSAAGDGGDFAL